MKTFKQYTLAKLGIWKPKIGAIYQADENFKFNPFEPDRTPAQVKVVDVKSEHVQYHNVKYPEALHSNTIVGFASYWLEVKG